MAWPVHERKVSSGQKNFITLYSYSTLLNRTTNNTISDELSIETSFEHSLYVYFFAHQQIGLF